MKETNGGISKSKEDEKKVGSRQLRKDPQKAECEWWEGEKGRVCSWAAPSFKVGK